MSRLELRFEPTFYLAEQRWEVEVCLYLWAAADTEGFSAPVLKGSVSEPGWRISDSSEPKGAKKAAKVGIWWLLQLESYN